MSKDMKSKSLLSWKSEKCIKNLLIEELGEEAKVKAKLNFILENFGEELQQLVSKKTVKKIKKRKM